MLSPINLGESQSWSSPDDISEPKTIFWVMPLDSILKGKLLSRVFATKADENQLEYEMAFDIQVDLVRFSLKKIENFKDFKLKMEKIKIASIEYEAVSKDSLKYIPFEIIPQLSKFITDISGMNVEEKKS